MGDSGEDTPGKGANGEKKGRRISFKSLSSKEKAKKWMAGEDTYGPGITDAEAEKAAHVARVGGRIRMVRSQAQRRVGGAPR